MKTYIITLKNQDLTEEKVEAPCCERLPQSGDVYQFTTSGMTPRGYYSPGDRLLIIDRTGQAPYSLLSSLGNLVVKCKYATSIWSNIERAIADGRLSLVEKS